MYQEGKVALIHGLLKYPDCQINSTGNSVGLKFQYNVMVSCKSKTNFPCFNQLTIKNKVKLKRSYFNVNFCSADQCFYSFGMVTRDILTEFSNFIMFSYTKYFQNIMEKKTLLTFFPYQYYSHCFGCYKMLFI